MEYLKLTELVKLPNNPRTITTEDMDKLIASIEKYWIIEWRPFLISTRTGQNVIIGGNQRFEACKKVWLKKVPVFIFTDLTEEQEREIIIRDNVSNWEWDYSALANEWDTGLLVDWWVDLPDFGGEEGGAEKTLTEIKLTVTFTAEKDKNVLKEELLDRGFSIK